MVTQIDQSKSTQSKSNHDTTPIVSALKQWCHEIQFIEMQLYNANSEANISR